MKHHHRNHHKLWHETLFRPLALHCTQWCTHTILHSLPPPLATRLYKNVQYVLRNKLWTSSWSVLPSCYQVYSIFSLTSGVHAQVRKYVGQAFRKNGTTSDSHVIFQQILQWNRLQCNKHKAQRSHNYRSRINYLLIKFISDQRHEKAKIGNIVVEQKFRWLNFRLWNPRISNPIP